MSHVRLQHVKDFGLLGKFSNKVTDTFWFDSMILSIRTHLSSCLSKEVEGLRVGEILSMYGRRYLSAAISWPGT